MASKRNLYRPAQVQENVGQRKPRKTLAQGRLITNGGPTQGSVPASGSSRKSSLLCQGNVNTNAMDVSGNVSALHHSQLSNTSMNSSMHHHSSLIQGRLEESLFSPRRQVPTVSEARTPNRAPPAVSLDLSDSDAGDRTPDSVSRYQKPDEVLCIDASRQTTNPDFSEVDIRIGVNKSPVKVVCHSPSRVKHKNQVADCGSPVTDSTNMRRHKPKPSAFTKEKVAGDHTDPYTAVQSIPISPSSFNDRRVLESLPRNYPQPNFSDSGGSDVIHPDKYDDRVSIVSDVSSSSMKDVIVTNHKFKEPGNEKHTEKVPTSVKKGARPETTRPDTGKKKKGRVVSSRYMQAAETKVKTSLSSRMDKSSFEKTVRASRSVELPQSAKKSVRKKAPANRQEKRREMERPTTPENQSLASSTGGKTSTPTMDASTFTHEMDIDASAIHHEASLTTGKGRTRSKLKQDLQDELMGQSICSNVSIYNQSTVSTKPKQQKRDLKSLQKSLDLHYMHCQLWGFMEAKAKKTLHEQEKQAMAQIYGIHEEVEKLRKIKSEKEQQYARLKHTNTTDHMAEVQRQCLGPVVENLPILQKQYSTLAYALDTTRHQIPVAGIHLPENEDQFQAKLEAQLLESERLLAEITTFTKPDAPNITAMGNAMVAMQQAVDKTQSELKKNRELLAAAETLTIQECCLRAQDIQSLDQS